MSDKWTAWKCESLLNPLWFLLSSIFLSFPPFFFSSFISSFFLSSYLCSSTWTTRVWFWTLWNMSWASHNAGIIFLWRWIFAQPEDKEAKARGHFLYIKWSCISPPKIPQHTELFFPVILCRTQKINHKLISTLVSGRKHLGADKIQFN